MYLGAVTLVAAAIAGSSGASAQSQGSFSGAVSNAEVFPTIVCDATNTTTSSLNCDNNPTPFLQLNIKVSNGDSSLLVGGSLQTAITTNTYTTGGGGQQKATATGSVIVYMYVDGRAAPIGCTSSCPIGLAYPPRVTYDERFQSLTTNLGSICGTTATGAVTCTSQESIQLILSTTSAHSFNFIVPGLSAGTHTIEFKIAASTDATATSALAGAAASVVIGVGSLTAQVVKTLTPFDSITVGPGGNPAQTFSF
jgi:hypothetical protein